MAITLGCPACGKRFRARDESAGKRVKCPYCAAAVPVPTAEEAAGARAATAPLPTAPPRPAPPPSRPPEPPRPAPPPSRPAVATPADWGAADPPPAPAPVPPPAPFPPPVDLPRPAPRGARVAAAPSRAERSRPADGSAKTPDQLAAPDWRKTRSGLFWVLFGLLLLSLPGFVGFAKEVSARGGVEWPTGPGGEWVSVPGYVNSAEPGGVELSKEELLDAAAYGLPVALGLFFVGVGRLRAGAAPRSSGAKGLFRFSGLFTLLAAGALVAAAVSAKLPEPVVYRYTALGFLVGAAVAEFWFLTGLAAAGVSLKRPGAARAVGLVGFVAALAAAAVVLALGAYRAEWRPVPVPDDVLMYEQGGVMLGWLLLVGVYWRAVRSLRAAITDFLTTVEE